MAKIQVGSSLNEKFSRLATVITNCETAQKEISSLCQAITAEWDGAAATQYNENHLSLEEGFKKYITSCSNLQKAGTTVVQNMQSTDEAGKQKLRGFGT